MRYTFIKYIKISLLITLYSGLSFLLINCGNTGEQGKEPGKEVPEQGSGNNTPLAQQTPLATTLMGRLKASSKPEYEKLIKEALKGQSDKKKKKILEETDEQDSTIGHYLASTSGLDAQLLKEICDFTPSNCTKLNKNGEGSFDLAAKSDKNLSKEIVDVYQSHTGPGVKFKDGDNFVHKIIKAKNAPDRNNTIVELLLTNSNIYFPLSKKISELFLGSNFKYLDAELFSALAKKLGPNATYNGIFYPLYQSALDQLTKKSEIQPLIARPDIKDADQTRKVTTNETGSYVVVPYNAPQFIRDTFDTLQRMAHGLSSKVLDSGAVIDGLKLIEDDSFDKLLEAIELYLERTRLEAIAQKNPTDNAARAAADAAFKLSAAAIKSLQAAQAVGKKVPDYFEWTKSDYQNLYLAQKDADIEQLDVPNKTYLIFEKALLKKAHEPLYGGKDLFITAQKLESIPQGKITDISYVFLNMNKAGWKNPIPGEVKYINGIRYQFVGQHPGDDYGVIVAVDDFNKIAQKNPFDFSTYYKTKIDRPWQDSDQKKLASGSYGKAYEVDFNNRKFVAKSNKRNNDTSREINAYELLNGIEGIGPYLGHVENQYVLLEKGEPLDTFAPTHKNLAEPFMKSLLKTMSEMHDRTLYHNDIKIHNMIVVNNKPYIIDFGNQSNPSLIGINLTWVLGKGHGFSSPYYEEGDLTGKKADLRALGFVFFGLKHFGEDAFKDSFYEPEKGVIILKAALKPEDIAKRIENGDKVDKVIAKMLRKQFNNASQALLAL